MATRKRSRNKVTIRRRPYKWTCQLCGEVTEHATEAASHAAAIRHTDKYHTTSEVDIAVLDALYDMVGGVPEYRAIIRRHRTRVKEVLELKRMYKLQDRRRK